MVIALAIALLLLVVFVELTHMRRCLELQNFLFHACRFPWGTLSALAATRVTGFALVALGTVSLWSESVNPAVLNSIFDDEGMDRLLIVLDCSNSMNLRDAGPERDISRGKRAAMLIDELLHAEKRLPPRTTLVVFADRADPLCVDTNDWNVIAHNLQNRNLSEYLFEGKETTIGAILRKLFRRFDPPEEDEDDPEPKWRWPDHSTVLLLVTDGDSDDRVGEIKLPSAIRRTVVVGVGSSEGKLIGSFQSRQDEKSLEAVAKDLGGRYFNCSESRIRVDALARPPAPATETTNKADGTDRDPIGQPSTRALALLGAGAALLVGATLAGPFLNPANATPWRNESPKFLA